VTASFGIVEEGGAHIYVRRWSSGRPTRVGFLLVHGMESHSEWFAEVAPPLAASGASVLAYDRAGSGKSPRASTHFTADAAMRDLRIAADLLRADAAEIHLVGMSWGGLLALNAAADQEIGRLAGVTLIAPSLFTKSLSLGFKLQVASGLLVGKPAALTLPIAPEDFTSRAAKLEYVRRDPLRAKSATPAFLWATRGMQARIRAMSPERAPKNGAVFLAETDALIDNEKTASFAERLGFAIKRFPRTKHSLVLEDPGAVAAALLDRGGLHVV